MEIILNDYHKKVNAEMRKSMEYWKEHPLSRNESLKRLRLLREQRLGCQGTGTDIFRNNASNYVG